eukprot:scaffold1.g5560.t1
MGRNLETLQRLFGAYEGGRKNNLEDYLSHCAPDIQYDAFQHPTDAQEAGVFYLTRKDGIDAVRAFHQRLQGPEVRGAAAAGGGGAGAAGRARAPRSSLVRSGAALPEQAGARPARSERERTCRARAQGMPFERYDIKRWYDCGDTVLLLVDIKATLPAPPLPAASRGVSPLPTGKTYEDQHMLEYNFTEDGRICGFRHWLDTAKHIRANTKD